MREQEWKAERGHTVLTDFDSGLVHNHRIAADLDFQGVNFVKLT